MRSVVCHKCQLPGGTLTKVAKDVYEHKTEHDCKRAKARQSFIETHGSTQIRRILATQ